MNALFKRVLLKLSGEALGKQDGGGMDEQKVYAVAEQLKAVKELGVEVAVVIGGGNFWRGRTGEGIQRPTADSMGMLATVMNALALEDLFNKASLPAKALCALEIPGVMEVFNYKKAIEYLEEGFTVIFGGGTGRPFFSTDTAAALRAAEISADIILSAKNVDGVYDSDPKTNPDAKKFEELTYSKIIEMGLKAIDTAAAAFCIESGIPQMVFSLNEEGNIIKAVCGINTGTFIK
ncbi:MAG: UMP kinase [Eubacteriaceae bacterium]|nr:UMP kinase [Eubacteriaceae bacterium]